MENVQCMDLTKSGENATTMALSTFSHLLAAQHMRSGESDVSLPIAVVGSGCSALREAVD